MTITTTLRNLVNAQAALQELATYKPKGKLCYDVGKLLRLCTVELAEHAKSQQASVEAHGTFDDKNGSYTFLTQAAQKAMKADTDSLLDSEVILEVSLLPFEELDKLNPTAGLYAQLDWAILPPKEGP